MTQNEHSLWHALIELDDTVKAMPTANPKPNLLPLFEKLDRLTRDLPAAARRVIRVADHAWLLQREI